MIVELRVLQGQPAGKTLAFSVGDYILGRGPECHVRFNSDWVSRQHCLLRVTGERAILRDLGSTNGTLVNGELCRGEQPLGTGDAVQIGPLVFEVRVSAKSAPPEGTPAPPLGPEGRAAEGQPPLGSTLVLPPGPDDPE